MPASLPSDHITMLGWFLSRSTVRSDAVEVRLAPRRVVARIADPAELVEAVRLQVAFEDHPEAEFVGQVEQPGMRRVVAGADRVDVEPLHAGQVRAGVLLVEDAAALGMGLVAVHPVEDDAAAVDQEPVAADLDRAETHPQRDALRGRATRWRRTGEAARPTRARTPSTSTRGHVGRRGPDVLDAEFGDAQGDREGGRVGGDLRLDPCRARRSKPVRSQTSSMPPAGRAIRVTSRKMPGSHHWSWSST